MTFKPVWAASTCAGTFTHTAVILRHCGIKDVQVCCFYGVCPSCCSCQCPVCVLSQNAVHIRKQKSLRRWFRCQDQSVFTIHLSGISSVLRGYNVYMYFGMLVGTLERICGAAAGAVALASYSCGLPGSNQASSCSTHSGTHAMLCQTFSCQGLPIFRDNLSQGSKSQL